MSANVKKYLYLLVKTHSVTGMRYLCKRVTTSDSNAISYLGSGTRWNNHLKVHGKHINTEIIAKYDLIEQMKKLNSNNPSINILTNGDIGYFLKKDRVVKNVKGWTKI
jgi:hypothetical protein